MLVKFRTTELAKCYQDERLRTKTWGEKVARLFIRRVEALQASATTKDLRQNAALKFHALHGPMVGQFAIWVDATWRIVLRFEDAAQTVVIIEEVNKHYGGTST